MIAPELIEIGPPAAPAGLHSGIRQRVHRALLAGALDRPGFCSTCGGPGLIQAHHEDYDRPLDVEWLCSECHLARHLGLAPACALVYSEGVSYIDPHPVGIQLDLVAMLLLDRRVEQLELPIAA